MCEPRASWATLLLAVGSLALLCVWVGSKGWETPAADKKSNPLPGDHYTTKVAGLQYP
jgi:hypothetical protein